MNLIFEKNMEEKFDSLFENTLEDLKARQRFSEKKIVPILQKEAEHFFKMNPMLKKHRCEYRYPGHRVDANFELVVFKKKVFVHMTSNGILYASD